MRILFDECVPKRLRKLFQKHDITTVQEAGWAGIKNGELLNKASEKFEVFMTVDRNLAFQQNPHKLAIPILQTELTNELHHIGR